MSLYERLLKHAQGNQELESDPSLQSEVAAITTHLAAHFFHEVGRTQTHPVVAAAAAMACVFVAAKGAGLTKEHVLKRVADGMDREFLGLNVQMLEQVLLGEIEAEKAKLEKLADAGTKH